jgi:tetratricopeptide (TPR) repeat protein
MVPPLMSTAIIAVLDGNLTKARSTFQEAVGLLHQTGDKWSLSWALNDLGHVLLMLAELDQAEGHFLEALTTARELGNQGVLLISLAGTAALIARRVKNLLETQPSNTSGLALAARMCGATVPLIGTPGIFAWADSKILYDAAIKQVQSLMSDDLWDKANSEGQRMLLDPLVELALLALKG